MKNEIKILNKQQIAQKILRLSWQIYENNFEEKEIVLVGIGEKGFLIAQSVKSHLSKISHFKTILSKISFNSDKSLNNIKLSLDEDEYKNKSVILIDDVLHSGKTLMYASKPFLNTTLKKMAIMVLVNRDHNSFPIKAKYVGLSLSTTLKEYIRVDLSNKNSGVYLS